MGCPTGTSAAATVSDDVQRLPSLFQLALRHGSSSPRVALCGPRATVAAEPSELVVVLADTGRTCQSGLPVLTRHPQAERYLPVLTTGMSGRLVRAYRLEQQWLAARDGREVEPAYLLLSSQPGRVSADRLLPRRRGQAARPGSSTCKHRSGRPARLGRSTRSFRTSSCTSSCISSPAKPRPAAPIRCMRSASGPTRTWPSTRALPSTSR